MSEFHDSENSADLQDLRMTSCEVMHKRHSDEQRYFRVRNLVRFHLLACRYMILEGMDFA